MINSFINKQNWLIYPNIVVSKYLKTKKTQNINQVVVGDQTIVSLHETT